MINEMKNTTLVTILTGAVIAGSAVAADDGKKLRGVGYDVLTDTQVVAENLTTIYANGPASVGASAMIVGSESEGNQDVIGQPKRMYMAFLHLPETAAHETLDLAKLTFYAESGTSWSSKDNTICDRPLTVEIHALTSQVDIPTLTWMNQFSGITTTYVGKVVMRESCSTTKDNPSLYTVDVTSAFVSGKPVYGFMLRADAQGELSPTVLTTSEQRWNAQTDVVIGTRETGNPATLSARYSTK